MIILIILIIVLLLSFLFINKTLKKKETVLEEVKLQENTTKSSSFAVMLEQDDGTYKEDTSSSWPTDMIFNEELSGCMDANGNKIDNILSYNYSTNSIKLRVSGATYCYVYFDLVKPSVTLTVSTDGVNNTLPTYNHYKQELNCKGADAYFNIKYQRLEISQVNKNATSCTLNYTSDTNSYTLLSEIVKNSSTEVSSTNKAGGTDISYRYIGKTPNNYVLFNNELWRIIGLVPVCLESGCGTPTTSLVKIIRNTSIGSLAYSTNPDKAVYWGSNMLYTILNEYYYGKKDGTNSDYCYGYYSSSFSRRAISNCDYSIVGISSDTTDYYGRMVKNVYWNTGNAPYTNHVADAYKNETGSQTISGYIGLMSGCDYGFASGYITSYYLNNLPTKNNWLYNNAHEYLINYDTASGGPLLVSYDGSLSGSNWMIGYNIRPVVYLDSSVYIIGGSGTQSEPYMLGM